MRLLRFGEQDELILGDFHYDFPPYAILSHTWDPVEEEYTFENLCSNEGQEKTGFQKILSFATQARSDGFNYFWVDTCCIDKSSAAELSDAVNSMFNWYRNARKCYVYLVDVGNFASNWNDPGIRRSRWFTRCWTLQELIAPKEMEFFSFDWRSLGTKESLRHLIHEITGIPLGALQGSSPSDFSINERISWTKGRQATRSEDHAYSLLGMFGTSMPVMYGEGKDRALTRFRKRLNEQFDWPVELNRPLDHLSRKYSERTEGEEDLNIIRESVVTGKRTNTGSSGALQENSMSELDEVHLFGQKYTKEDAVGPMVPERFPLRDPSIQSMAATAESVRQMEEKLRQFKENSDIRSRETVALLRAAMQSSGLLATVFSDLKWKEGNDEPIRKFLQAEATEYEASDLEDVESIFSDTGVSMSSRSSVEQDPIRVSGIREVSRVFLSHEGFSSLCKAAINQVAMGKSRAHIRGFLKVYGQQLDEEARNPLQHQAAKFVREAAGRIADEIGWSIKGFEEVGKREITAEEKPNLERWLATVGEGEIENPAPPAPTDDIDSDEDGSEDDMGTAETFPHIDAVKDFLLSSQAFESLLREFDHWTNLKRRPNSPARAEITSTLQSQKFATFNKPIEHNHPLPADHLTAITPNKIETLITDGYVINSVRGPPSSMKNAQSLISSISDFWGITFSFYDLLDLFVPSPPDGCERIRWRCTCNTLLWGDFPSGDSQALMQLKQDLLQNLIPTPYSSRNGFSESLATEQPANNHGDQASLDHEKVGRANTISNLVSTFGNAASSFLTGGQNSQRSNASFGPGKLDSTSVPTSLTEVTVDTGNPVYFEVCTNIGNSAIGHFELDITRTTTDGELFEKIWGIYHRNRGMGLRRLFLRPYNVHFVLFSISTMKTTRYSAGIHAKPAEYPPDGELQHRRYHYLTPKLMMPSHIFLHYLHRAKLNVWGDHANDTWLKRLPKKLNDSMLAVQASEADPDSDLVFGWGVHILDGPNHTVLGFLLAAGLVITFAISCLVLGIAKTQEQAFGVGSYLIAIVVALMSAVYFKLQDQ